MVSFKYQYGDRPLEGYTIEHGLGRGGFGEVYYAVSDSGRQVAIKAVQNYEEIELRGISHCMNLKSPHLVTIFDVKFNDRGEPFVIMEFVSGPSLRQLLDGSPDGLGYDKAAFFVREIGRGLNYLHDCGVVHRDLKPHNVFYEDGIVKIGDYSLSKVITTSHRSGHTITVGTVHYMAPEISMGRYGPSVDIYALGVMLYEMLRGEPPFTGQSMGEVLMKHMTAQPDVSGIREPFARIIRQAMAKQPEDRFATPLEMVQALFGHHEVQESMASFNPASLTVIAQRTGQRVAAIAGVDLQETRSFATPVTPRPAEPIHALPHEVRPLEMGRDYGPSRPRQAYWAGRGVGRAMHYLGMEIGRWYHDDHPVDDPISAQQRMKLALATLLAMTVVLSVVMGELTRNPFHVAALGLLILNVMAAFALSIRWTADHLMPRLQGEPSIVPRIAFTGVGLVAATTAALATLLVTFPFQPREVFSPGTLLACAVPLLVLNCSRLTYSGRRHRLMLGPALAAAGIALIAAIIAHGYPPLAAGMAAASILAVQLSSPWQARTRSSKSKDSALPENAGTSAQSERVRIGADEAALQQPARTGANGATPQHPQIGHVSSQSRLVTLLLAVIPGMFGVCGIQRFYTGRVVTGLLWLVTFGILGIGQIIDIILIAVGSFRDGRGRLVWQWQTTPGTVDEPVNSWSKVREQPQDVAPEWRVLDQVSALESRVLDQVLGLIGGLLLVGAVVIGLITAFNVPMFIHSGLIPNTQDELMTLEQTLGSRWPELFVRLGTVLGLSLGIMGLGFLIVSRRRTSPLHMLRVLLAGGAFLISMLPLSAIFGRWRWSRFAEQMGSGQLSDALLMLLQPEQIATAAFASVIGIFGVLLLAWPYRRRAAPRSKYESRGLASPSSSVGET